MISFKNILFLLFLLHSPVGTTILTAQSESLQPTFQFELFNLPGGDVGNSVQAIVQDSFGYMWFGSQYGLHRWDGNQFKTFLHDLEDSTSIASNYIETLYVAKDGTLWIGHWGKGLDRFDYSTETFQHYHYHPDNVNNNSRNYILDLKEDQQGDLWIGTGGGLFRLNTKTGKSKLFTHNPDNENSLSFNTCRVLLVDSEGTLWVGVGFPWGKKDLGGLHRYRPETEDFIRYQHDPSDPSSLTTNRVSALFEDSKGNFWVGTNGDGLHLMDRKSGAFQRLQKNPNNPQQLCGPFINDDPSRHIRFIFEDQQHKIWIGAIYGGLKYYDPATGYIKEYYHQENNPQTLPELNPWTILQSRDGTFWASSSGPDKMVYKFKETSYESFPLQDQNHTVFSFSETADGKIWVGSDQMGLFQLDGALQEIKPYQLSHRLVNIEETTIKNDSLQKNNLLNWTLKTVADDQGFVWINKYLPEGLFRLDPKTGDIKLFQHDPRNKKSISAESTTDILKDPLERIWTVTSKRELNLYIPDAEDFIKYKFNASPSGIATDYFSRLAPASDDKIWIFSTGFGNNPQPPLLHRFDPQNEKFDPINASILADDLVLKHETVHGLQEDHQGNLWICTDTRLLKINLQTESIDYFKPNHFGLLFFKGIVFDDQERLWLLGDKIAFFDPLSGAISNFITSFNLQPAPLYNQFIQYIFKDTKGFIYLGGQGGFQRFDPRKIKFQQLDNPTESLINNFQLLSTQKKENDSIATFSTLSSDKLKLQYNQNAFSFHFTSLAFHHPESNRFEFQLEGYDEHWRATGLEPKATYVKVPPGEYTFKVRSATLRGEWGPEKTIGLYIAPPWWATWWAYCFYALSFLGLMYTFYSIQLNRKLDKAEARRLKELVTVKTRLYTNITHEFRTPLTVISGMASQIKNNPKEWFNEGLNMIQRNSSRLLDLVNQMLDLSKLEDGKMRVHLQQGDIINYIKYLVESFHSFAQSQKIKLHFLSSKESFMMDFDHEKIKQIMSNLISNAVKFTPADGDIYVSIEEQKEDTDQQYLKINIKDTGQGISEFELPNIFERFYQIDATPTRKSEGTGIGLALTKELLQLMDGEISVKSNLHKGTVFTLLLPVSNKAPLIDNHPQDLTSNNTFLIPDYPSHQSNQVKAQNIPDVITTQKPNILLIEDNPDVVAYIASCLHNDYLIKVGKDGQEGIDIALKNIPDLIITDVMMPYKDGFEVCRTLKKDERTSHIPIIMLTARADIASKLEGLEEGVDAYLAKPFHQEELLLRIRKLLESRRQLQQHYLSLTGVKTAIKEAPKVSGLDDYFVIKVTRAVETHLDDANFGPMELARSMTLSHSQLHRKLSAITGYSAGKFIRYIRLNKAKALLQNPVLSISSIASDTGFSDPSYFGRVFRHEFEMTPSEWRAFTESSFNESK